MGSLQDMSIPRFPLLTERETVRLLKKARKGDQKAREKLVSCNFRLVFTIVKRFEGRGFDPEDLFQIGVIGLIKAIDNFDPDYGVRFSTYAVPMIIGEIKRFLRDDHPIKITRALKEKGILVKRIREKLVRELGREPTVGEIAAALNLGKEEVTAALEAAQLPMSLFETLNNNHNEGDSLSVLDCLSSEGEQEHAWLERIALRDALTRLPERERRIIWLRFFEDKTQAEVGALLGLSQVQISRLERQAMARLRDHLRS
ncbi:MAG TPA: SigB/SigF/SigG family RNA polymerase sigma factor [Syntrophomonadaceae bacterium]|nr:SigB/SigF/SigG family RNA polymerase sigma factor [Syntrophomonadaceae bacterium]